MPDLIITLLILLTAIILLSIFLRVVFKRPVKEILWDWLSQLF